MPGASCRLCRREAQLRNSHVLPEFLYREVYDETSHSFVSVSNHPRHSRPLTMQKGLRERLLCQDCEGRLGRYESYAAALLMRAGREADSASRIGTSPAVARITPFDYSTFKLFGLSVLWRMGESSLHFYSAVRLGPHQERLRTMILADDPGEPQKYPFVLVRIAGVDFAPTFIGAPGPTRFGDDAIRAYTLVAMGFDWVFLASAQTGEIGRNPYFVGNALPDLLVPVRHQSRDEYIRELRSYVPGLGRQ